MQWGFRSQLVNVPADGMDRKYKYLISISIELLYYSNKEEEEEESRKQSLYSPSTGLCSKMNGKEADCIIFLILINPIYIPVLLLIMNKLRIAI